MLELERLERHINEMPSGPERDQYLANFRRMCARLAKVPGNVVARNCASANEMRAVLEEELRAALAEFHRGN
jgi:hypothetical protein